MLQTQLLLYIGASCGVWSVNDKKATLCISHITILKWQMLYVVRLMKKEEKNVTNLEEKETSDTVNDKVK